jgi:glutathione S-transferase
MSLKLYFHPLSSFCMKVVIALYEKDLPFEGVIVNFGDPAESAQFAEMWPIRKFPLLHDEGGGALIPESTTIIEYLDLYYPKAKKLLPEDQKTALKARQLDRFFDLYVHLPMQKIVDDRLRPEGKKDPLGVAQAKSRIMTAYDILEKDLAGKHWATGSQYTIADCSASPALFYANLDVPVGDDRANLTAYLGRLMRRPSFARVIEEAEPYFHMRPQ